MKKFLLCFLLLVAAFANKAVAARSDMKIQAATPLTTEELASVRASGDVIIIQSDGTVVIIKSDGTIIIIK